MFEISQVKIHDIAQTKTLSAQIDFNFNRRAMNALLNGVPLTIGIVIEVYRERTLWIDAHEKRIRQKYQIRYRALTKQFMVKNLNTGDVDNFSDFGHLLDKIGILEGIPLLQSAQMHKAYAFYLRMRAILDKEALPVPLRLRAYFSRSWDLESDWFICKL